MSPAIAPALDSLSPTNRSTGPITDEGKSASRRNAVKHGLSGKGIALPREDQAAFDAMLERFTRDLVPQDEVQSALVRQVALSTLRLERMALQEQAVLAPKVLDAAYEFRKTELDRVLELGRKLMDDAVPRCNLELLGGIEYPAKVNVWNAHEPRLLVMELEHTLTGCDWMIDRWREIATALEVEDFLHYDNKYKMIRLLGKRAETLLEDRQVGDIVVNCRALHPHQWEFQTECNQVVLGTENRPMYEVRIAFLEARMPEDRATALSFLRRVIDTRLAELHALRQELEPIQAVRIAQAETRAAFDDSKEGQLRRRYEADCSRQLHRSLASLKALQKSPPPEKKPEKQPNPYPPRPASSAPRSAAAPAPARGSEATKPQARNELPRQFAAARDFSGPFLPIAPFKVGIDPLASADPGRS